MDKKFWIVLLVFSIICIGPASAVQISSVDQLNSNGISDDKKLKNIETSQNDNNVSDINKTITNETNDNTIITNQTNDNTTITNQTNDNTTITNATMNNSAVMNGTMNETGDLNGTICDDTNNSTENADTQLSHEIRNKVLLTVTATASICLATATVFALIPDCTATKLIAAGFAVAGGCCFIAAIIISWCWW